MKLNNILTNFKKDINSINNINDLNIIKSKYIGKKSLLNKYIKNILNLSINNKIILGNKLNNIKKEINYLYTVHKNNILYEKNNFNNEYLDIYLPGKKIKIGSLHPISITLLEIEKYFNNLGFITSNFLEIEEPYYNFDALNIPFSHLSRNKKSTFWINNDKILRTHTSCSQIRILEKNKPPFKIISYGKVYRFDKDKTHTPMFHQLDGFIIDNYINLKLLKSILKEFVLFFFKDNLNIKIRFRNSYFPFTEPSLELDIFNNNNWIEILGCGMIHPNILNSFKINKNKYLGMAFGIGIERLIMIKYNINDIKILFDNNIRFLNKFSYI